MEYDYTSELISKWAHICNACDVSSEDQLVVSQRLEAAHRRTLGHRGDPDALQQEIRILTEQGYLYSRETRCRDERTFQTRNRR